MLRHKQGGANFLVFFQHYIHYLYFELFRNSFVANLACQITKINVDENKNKSKMADSPLSLFPDEGFLLETPSYVHIVSGGERSMFLFAFDWQQ